MHTRLPPDRTLPSIVALSRTSPQTHFMIPVVLLKKPLSYMKTNRHGEHEVSITFRPRTVYNLVFGKSLKNELTNTIKVA